MEINTNKTRSKQATDFTDTDDSSGDLIDIFSRQVQLPVACSPFLEETWKIEINELLFKSE